MKTIDKIIVLVAAFFLFIPTAFASSAPKGVNEIIVVMDEFEKSFADYQWLEASVAIAQIRKELQQVFSESQVNDEGLSSAAENLMRSVVKKSREETEINFALFREEFFTFINFEFDVPPVLSMVNE